jgi:hypothetical protein
MSAILTMEYGTGDKDGVVVGEIIEVSIEGVERHDLIPFDRREAQQLNVNKVGIETTTYTPYRHRFLMRTIEIVGNKTFRGLKAEIN